MTSFFGGGASVTQPNVPDSTLRIQSSVQGLPIPIGWGQSRVAGNMIWYGGFTSTAVQQSQQSGKGGGVTGGGGGKGSSGNVTYTYSASFAFALSEGPIAEIVSWWVGKAIQGTPSSGAGRSGGGTDFSAFSTFTGSYSQSPWPYLTTNYPTQADNYRGISYVAFANYPLGSSPAMPDFTFEVRFAISNAYAGVPDANMAAIIPDFFSNAFYGIGFPSALVGDLSNYSNYCVATGLAVSPVLTTQQAANSFLSDAMMATNSEIVWSGGLLNAVPYGDTAITANGATFTPPAAPLYDLTDDDFIISSGSDYPIQITRQRVADQDNSIKVEYLDRTNAYNPTVVEIKDDAAIQAFGLRARSTTALHMFALASAAATSSALMLGRAKILNTYVFTVSSKYILLDPMDIVTLTEAATGLARQWVRIKEIQENENFSLTITAEDYLNGTGHAPLYGQQANTGFVPNYNAAPGAVQTPFFFEPTAALAGGLEVWMAVCGLVPATWGGCFVFVSYDGVEYRNVGRILGPARMGKLTAPLPAVTAATSGATIDQTNTLAIDLSQSGSQLTSGSQTDALALNTLCYSGGEFLAYQTATLTGVDAYNLTYLVRGAYSSPISTIPSQSPFVRCDDGVFRFPYTQDRIGTTLSVKLASINPYGGGEESLANVAAFTYVFQGTALSSPPADVVNFTANFQSSVSQLTWDEIKDFRPILYEVRKGSDWASGQVLGRFAHPPVPTHGDGTYWIAAYTQPVPNLQVYSAHPTSLSVSGSVLPANLMATWDEFDPATWINGRPSGIYGGTAFFDNTFIRTGGGDDFLAASDVISGTGWVTDWLNTGAQGNGTYEVPDGTNGTVSHEISIGRVAPVLIQITWTSSGVPQNQNFFAYDPLFSITDFFGASANQLINVYPEIAISQDGVTFGPWQKFSTGTYLGRKFKARMQIQSIDPLTIAYLTSFTFTVYAPTRVDHFVNKAILATGTALTFVPDGSSTPTPFNGGPNSATQPNILVNILNAQPGDVPITSGVTLSQCTVQVQNNGVGVARSCNVFVEGF